MWYTYVSVSTHTTNHCSPFAHNHFCAASALCLTAKVVSAYSEPHGRLCGKVDVVFWPNYQCLGAVDFHCFGS